MADQAAANLLDGEQDCALWWTTPQARARVQPSRRGAIRVPKISVLLTDAEEERFDAYCREKGFKKSTLAARLIREHLDREGYAVQRTLSLGSRNPALERESPRRGGRGRRRSS